MASLEQRVEDLESKYKFLATAYLQMQNNQSKTTEQSDINKNDVKALTPYTATAIGYYGEKQKTFYDVPQGYVSVMFDRNIGDYAISRIADRVTVSFDALTEQTNITISVK